MELKVKSQTIGIQLYWALCNEWRKSFITEATRWLSMLYFMTKLKRIRALVHFVAIVTLLHIHFMDAFPNALIL